jgi:hypothetical protein
MPSNKLRSIPVVVTGQDDAIQQPSNLKEKIMATLNTFEILVVIVLVLTLALLPYIGGWYGYHAYSDVKSLRQKNPSTDYGTLPHNVNASATILGVFALLSLASLLLSLYGVVRLV